MEKLRNKGGRGCRAEPFLLLLPTGWPVVANELNSPCWSKKPPLLVDGPGTGDPAHVKGHRVLLLRGHDAESRVVLVVEEVELSQLR